MNPLAIAGIAVAVAVGALVLHRRKGSRKRPWITGKVVATAADKASSIVVVIRERPNGGDMPFHWAVTESSNAKILRTGIEGTVDSAIGAGAQAAAAIEPGWEVSGVSG